MPADLPAVLQPLSGITSDLELLYQDLHQHPELSFAEKRTAAEVARRLEAMGYEVTTGVGRTGVVGTLTNGEGPTVLLRADMDALPVAEETGLPYASTATGVDPEGKTVPVMHACGHDMHTTCLLGALDLLARARDTWSGKILAVFQPAEELGGGAESMVGDNLFDRFGLPEVCLGQHVVPAPAGSVVWHTGPSFAATDSLKVTLFGRGGHGSRPETTVDPVVMAASTVLRLQTVVSREIAGSETAVVTVGSLHAGNKENVIPNQAELKLSIRSYTPEVRAKVLAAVHRIIKAEAAASGAEREPEISPTDTFPVLDNDADAVGRAMGAIRDVLGDRKVIEGPAVTGSEDMGVFGTEAGAPTCYWLLGGTDPATYIAALKAGRVDQDIPSNHQSTYAPVIQPTLTTGVTALTSAALAWLAPGGDVVAPG